MKKWLIILVVLGVAMAVYWRKHSVMVLPGPLVTPEPAATPPDNATHAGPNSVLDTVPSSNARPDPAFAKWIHEEANQIEQLTPNSAAIRQRLVDVTRSLTPAQAWQLFATARSPGAPAKEKIFAAFVLAEAGDRANVQLQQLITAPVITTAPQEPHSEGEMKGIQERSLRLMALEALIGRAEHDPAAREVLEHSIPNIPDTYMKQLAQRRLDEFKRH